MLVTVSKYLNILRQGESLPYDAPLLGIHTSSNYTDLKKTCKVKYSSLFCHVRNKMQVIDSDKHTSLQRSEINFALFYATVFVTSTQSKQGILKGEVSLYH